MKWSVIGLLCGRVMMNNNVELCSDWLFHSAAQCWALLWLAVSQCGSMLSSALNGCFTVRLSVELCSEWLFHSAAQCWALLWLAVSQCGSVLSSALIGCFTVRLSVELCSDWLFHSAAHFSSSHSRKETQGKNIFQYFLAINMLGIETAFKCTIAFYFHFRDSRSHKLIRHHPQSSLLTLFMW